MARFPSGCATCRCEPEAAKPHLAHALDLYQRPALAMPHEPRYEDALREFGVKMEADQK